MLRRVVRLVGLTAAVGCAGGGAVADRDAQPAEGEGAYLRRLAPFPVLDAEGDAYAIPFLGGLNVPRPQWVDLEGDGDTDLFLQEETGRLLFLERLPGGPEPRYAPQPDRFTELSVGEWYRFVDVDADGDPDLFAEEPFSQIRLYRNRGTGRHTPAFELAVDTLRDATGKPIFADRQNIPNAGDLDCDGRLDLLIGRTDGTVVRYEATGAIGADVPTFQLVTERFEDIQIIGQLSPGLPTGRASWHGANTMALADVDGDGDLDLYWGDFFEPGLLLIENRGSCAEPNFRNAPRPFPLQNPIKTSGYNAPTFADVDGDGDVDLLIGVLGGAFNATSTLVDNLLFLEHDARNTFALRTSRYVTQIDVGSESIPALHDLDGDGDLDLMVANKIDPDSVATSRIHVFMNVGRPGAPSFRRAAPLAVEGAYDNAPAFGDLDGDGDPDLILGTWRPGLRYLRNDGNASAPRFVLVDSALVQLTRGSNATPTLGDLDGDGDLDLMVGESSGTVNYYSNVGSPRAPRFELVSDEYAGIKVRRRSAPALADMDRDGDLDLLLGSESEGVLFYRNEGTRATPRFVAAVPPALLTDVPSLSAPTTADLDRDGDLDLIVGGAGGGVVYFEHLTR